MLALIIDFYWYGTTQDPVQITVKGTLADLRRVTHINPSQVVDNWPRSSVIPVEQHNVISDLTGGVLTVHICAQRGSNFMDMLHQPEIET